MAYNDTPLANQRIKDTQAPIRENFQTIQTSFSVDHAPIQSGANEGKHNKISMPVQGAAPAFAAGEVGLFNKLPAAPFPLTGRNELFIHSASGVDSLVTARADSALVPLHGYSYLPSGILLKWGRFDGLVPGNNALVLPLVNGGAQPLPDFASFLTAQITTIAIAITGSVRFNSYTLGTRTLSVNADTSGNVGIFYLLIGT